MSHDITKKQMIKILAVAFLLGGIIFIYDLYDTKLKFDGTIERNEAGKGIISEELELKYHGESRTQNIEIADKRLSDDAVQDAFSQAINEINESYLGENKTADWVCYDLQLEDSYADGLVKAEWQFDDYSIVTYEGHIQLEGVEKSGKVVNALVSLSYEDVERTYGFSFTVKPFKENSKEALDAQLKQALEVANDNEARAKDYILPKEIGGENLVWSKKMNYRGIELAMLGVVCVIALIIGKKSEKQQSEKNKLLEKERDYPLIVSELSVLIGAGMSLRKALERITERYTSKLKTGNYKASAGYEEMLMTYRSMMDGRGEMAALEELGVRSEQKEYRKLAMLLSQNIKKGSKDLINALEQEEINAFSMRKQRAVRLGEEASTKLLAPMGGMLMIVMVILIVPAILQMNI